MSASHFELAARDGRCLSVRTLNASDLTSVLAIETAAHSHPWNQPRVEQALEKYQGFGLCDESGDLLGFAFVMTVAGEAELLDFVVDPKQQGQGLGYLFVEWLVQNIAESNERFYLEVRVSNKPAICIYENVGFVEVGLRPNYYPADNGREDALLMAMELFK